MATTLHTWRISDPATLAAGDAATLATGLRYHLATARLDSILVQVGTAQQAYVTLAGCPGCATDRCVVGCRTDLLRRTLRAAGGPGVQLHLVKEGLNPQGYRTFLWAWPAQSHATPIDGNSIAGWPRARLALRWQPAGKNRIRVGAFIALGGDTDGPPLAPRLRELGWLAQPVPALLARGAAHPRWSLTHLRAGPWTHPLWLALPAPVALGSVSTMVDIRSEGSH